MRALVFDVETSGFWSNKKEANDNTQGNIMQLAFQYYDDDRVCRHSLSTLLSPLNEGLICNDKAFEKHKIPMSACYDHGLPQRLSLGMFYHAAVKADCFVAHNSTFDVNMVKKHFMRIGADKYIDIFDKKPVIDTMKTSIPIVKALPKKYGKYKYPSLSECALYYWNEEIEGAHDALIDVKYCAKIFYELVDRGYFIDLLPDNKKIQEVDLDKRRSEKLFDWV